MRIEKPPHTLLCVAVLLVGSCAHAPAPALESLLSLDVSSDIKEFVPGTYSNVAFQLRNNGSETLDVCVETNGVSVWFENDQGRKWPSILHGIAFDASCYLPLRLEGGTSKQFVEKVGVWKGFPEGKATLNGSVSVGWPKHEQSREIRVTRHVNIRSGGGAPANLRLQRTWPAASQHSQCVTIPCRGPRR